MVIKKHGLNEKAHIGVDQLDSQLIIALQEDGFRLGDGQDVMLNARSIKTMDEIMIMENASATVDAAFYKVAQFIIPGVRENEIQAVAAHELHRLGGQWVINVQVTSGARTHPHPHLSSDRLIQPGDLIFADIVTLLNGYHTCYYRTLSCGKATQKQRDIYGRTYEMLYKGINAANVGATTADICKQWPTCDYWGFKNESEAFGLAFAHGLGVGLWERPVVSRSFSMEHPVELKEGMVMAFETYDGEGIDGARIEEEVVITSDGPKVISKFPSDELIACPIL
jgi:Xaa-Pro aminopeptidase